MEHMQCVLQLFRKHLVNFDQVLRLDRLAVAQNEGRIFDNDERSPHTEEEVSL